MARGMPRTSLLFAFAILLSLFTVCTASDASSLADEEKVAKLPYVLACPLLGHTCSNGFLDDQWAH